MPKGNKLHLHRFPRQEEEPPVLADAEGYTECRRNVPLSFIVDPALIVYWEDQNLDWVPFCGDCLLALRMNGWTPRIRAIIQEQADAGNPSAAS